MTLDMLDCITLEPSTAATACVIWMHGLGADGNDFAGLVPELDLSGCPAIRFIFPHAPSLPVTINGGYVMPAWYDILASDLVKREDEAGLRQSRLQIEEIIAGEKARGIPASRIVVAGFSQGCAMALMVGLRHAEKLAGIVGMSGYLPLADKTAAERSAANQDTPIFLAHGTRDGVVALPRATASRDALAAIGYAVEWREYAMEHSVCPQEVLDLEAFLKRVLA